MLDLLVLTVLLPLCGAGCLLVLSRFISRLRLKLVRLGVSVLACGIAVGVLGIVLLLRTQAEGTTAVSLWDSSLLAESAIRLGLDRWLWSLGLALSLATCSFLLAEIDRGPDSSFVGGGVTLALLGAGLAAIWSANPLTTLISWGLYDLILMLGEIASGSRSGLAVRRFAFGSLSVLCLWAGVQAAGNGTGSVQWSFMPPGGAKMTLWVLAGLLRLGAYPFHFSIPLADAASVPVAAGLLAPGMGWTLWMRLVLVDGGVLAHNAWLLAPAAMTLVVGGLLGWAAEAPMERRAWIGMGISGAAMLAVVVASGLATGEGSGGNIVLPIMTLGATGWLLSVPVIALGGNVDTRPLSRRWSWLPTGMSVLGAVHLVGLPPTMGFAAQSLLMRGLATTTPWGWTVGAFVGQLFLVAAVARWLAPTLPPGRLCRGEHSLLSRMLQGAALTCPVLLIIGGGLFPMLLVGSSAGQPLESLMAGPGATSWLLWAVALILGALLGWQDTYVRRRVSLWLNVLHDFVRLDWALVLLVGALEQGLAVLRAVDDVLGGRGALLWALIMLLLAILVWRVS